MCIQHIVKTYWNHTVEDHNIKYLLYFLTDECEHTYVDMCAKMVIDDNLKAQFMNAIHNIQALCSIGGDKGLQGVLDVDYEYFNWR